MEIKSYLDEIWVDIIGYEKLYMVSNYGRVKSLGNDKSRKDKILKQNKDSGGYLFVKLSKNGVRKPYLIHILVAIHFIPNPECKSDVHHIDHNKENNNFDNLIWLTRKEHLAEHPDIRKSAGKAARKVKSKHINQFTRDGLFIRAWYSSYDIQRELGFFQSSIIKCCRGKLKQAYGYIWKYADKE